MENNLKIKRVLGANATFSLLSGLPMIAANSFVESLLGVEIGTVLYFIGAGLLFFAAYLRFISNKKFHERRIIISIAMADFAWVVGSLVLLFIPSLNFSPEGKLLIIVIATIVCTFGILQLKYNQ